jgi:alpha,alpha-trehalose-phosphate synthase [UDP-forming]
MRLGLRLSLSLVFAVAMVSLALAFYQTQSAEHGLRRDLDRHSQELAESLDKSAAPLVVNRSSGELQALVDRFQNHEGLAGVAIYDAQNQTLAVTSNLAARLGEIPPVAERAVRQGRGASAFFRLDGEPMEVFSQPIRSDGVTVGVLAIFHDSAYIDRQSAAMWRRALASIGMEAILIVAVTLLVLRWRLGIPLARLAEWLHDLRIGAAPKDLRLPESVFDPIKHEVTRLATTLTAARAAAEEEARLRNAAESLWTPERLRISVRNKLDGSRLFAVSNREPYEHVRRGNSVECSVPASGLVTALEPILRACAGTWIAQGTGNADRETVDEHNHLQVPPDDPQYTLRRVWLTAEEEQGFYFGFANEGLWPLSHLAHTRPIFRAQDWAEYCKVNRRFADATIEEIKGDDNPVVLVQDYHFALVPRMIKEARPDARVAIFWHIPWPNPEAFGICPWQHELLEGLLGADLIGFHIQSHCNNFLDSVDRTLQSRVDREHFAVSRRDHLTYVRPFPISVAFTNGGSHSPSNESPYEERARLFAKIGVKANMLGIGVDRIDYTKGLPERIVGLETFFEKHPIYRGQFTFVQIGAPSRTHIRRYQDLMEEIKAEVERINQRFQTGNWKPLAFLPEHHSHEQILPYYRAADLCMVTSLHDGMNLVAKEYVAAQSDAAGVLILSRFAGASQELADALLVNPYDAEDLAAAIHKALQMSPEERYARMARMRTYVREHNIYRWAGNLIAELASLRLDTPEQVASVSAK